MAQQLHTRISDSLDAALRARAEQTGESVDHLVQSALADAFQIEQHSIFQVSTAGALVEGVFQGCVSVADLLRHGDFGLGTFESLDGEMIVLDGECFQARSGGKVVRAGRQELTPFAVVTRFTADESDRLASVSDMDDFTARLDVLRDSDNGFVGIRAKGLFSSIDLRAACKTHPGVRLVEATSHQSEFTFKHMGGTLVGFWSPPYASAISVSGFHLHFISDDLQHGGHVLNLQAEELLVEFHQVNDLHFALPETREFLEAELRQDNAEALAIAERAHRAPIRMPAAD